MHWRMETWDDLRILLAVHRAGTLSAAARELGVNQSTVSRRVARLARLFRATLLEARGGRYALTSAGLLALQRAEVVEAEIHTLERQLDRLDDRPEGTVRLSAPDGLGSVVIAARLAAFREEHPGIELLLAAESPVVNLVQREADVAVRVVRSTQRELLVRRIARVGFLPYATADYLTRRDGRRELRDDDDLVVHDNAGDSPETRWLLARVPRGRVRFQSPSPLGVEAAVAGGAGVGMLPGYLGRRSGLLALAPGPVVTRDVFLVIHRAMARLRRIRAVCGLVEQAVAGM
jgi:molybdate transport repressor ModE-like protein